MVQKKKKQGQTQVKFASSVEFQSSFHALKNWIKELTRYGPPDILIAIAGNKCDKADQREVCFCFQGYYLIRLIAVQMNLVSVAANPTGSKNVSPLKG